MSTAPVVSLPAEAAPTSNVKGLALIESLKRPGEIPRHNRVYVNRNLKLSNVEVVGFDMDYTLALYNQPRIEELSISATVDKLVKGKGYPEAIRAIRFDPALGIRG